MFDWKRFLDKYNVEWVESGANVARGNIGINCPWCGPLDSTHHLGINCVDPEKWSYNCWKDPLHKGKHPYYLIQKIAKCSRQQAIAIYDGSFSSKVELEDLERLLLQRSKVTVLEEQSFSKEEFLLESGLDKSQRFFRFLEFRGFLNPGIVAETYRLRGAISGSFASRIIFPFYIEGKLYGWSGRAISDSKIRYKTAPSGSGVGRNLIYNYDGAKSGGRTLFICEGPFDALKVDHFGSKLGARAVALLGLSMTPAKAKLICKLSENFDRVVILLDSTATAAAMSVREALGPLSEATIMDLPEHIKDPGDLEAEGVHVLVERSHALR